MKNHFTLPSSASTIHQKNESLIQEKEPLKLPLLSNQIFNHQTKKEHSETVEEIPVIKQPVQIDKALLKQLEKTAKEEGQVIVHCTTNSGSSLFLNIRIWPTTYLIPTGSAYRAKLLYSENISLYPEWQSVGFLQDHHFTLIFEKLPKDCESFDLLEDIPEEGGYYASNIKRNATDVYHVKL